MTLNGSPDEATTTYARIAALGFVAGLRSMMPFAILSRTYETNGAAHDALPRPLRLLDSGATRGLTAVAAAGEVVGDKLPMVPSRLQPGPLAGRLAVGALAGATLSHRTPVALAIGTALGAAAAGAGSAAGYYARKRLGDATSVPDPAWAVLEDSLALGLGLLSVRGFTPSERA